MDPMPAMKRKSGGSRRVNLPGLSAMPALPSMKSERLPLNRRVEWQPVTESHDGTEFTKGSEAEIANVIGRCARCHQWTPAVELRWRNDRNLFGRDIPGSWECRQCHPKAGKFDVRNGGTATRKFSRETGDERKPTPTELEGMQVNKQQIERMERVIRHMGYLGLGWNRAR